MLQTSSKFEITLWQEVSLIKIAMFLHRIAKKKMIQINNKRIWINVDSLGNCRRVGRYSRRPRATNTHWAGVAKPHYKLDY